MRRSLVSAMSLALAAGLVGVAPAANAEAAGPPPTYPIDSWWGTIQVGAQPKGVASTGDTSVVANAGDGTVTWLMTCAPKNCGPSNQSSSGPAGPGPTSVVVNAQGTPYVSNADADTVTVLGPLDGRPIAPVATIPVGSRPAGLAIDSANVYVANNGSNSVSVIDQSTNTVVATIPVGAQPWGLATDGTVLYVANAGGGTVSVVDIATRTVAATIAVGAAPAGLALDGRTLYVADNGSASVSVVDTGSRTVTATIPVGAQPWGLAVAGGALFVANYGARSVSVIDTATRRPTATLTSPGTPYWVAAGTTGQVVVTDTSANALFVVPLAASTWAPTWSSNRARRSVTGVVANVPGTTYAIVAKAGAKSRTGTCTAVGSNVRCTVRKLPRGTTWRVSVTSQLPWQAAPGGRQNKKFRF